MDDFEKWAQAKAKELAEGLDDLMLRHRKVLTGDGLKYLILKAMRTGYEYNQNNKQ